MDDTLRDNRFPVSRNELLRANFCLEPPDESAEEPIDDEEEEEEVFLGDIVCLSSRGEYIPVDSPLSRALKRALNLDLRGVVDCLETKERRRNREESIGDERRGEHR
jgi:hypothetical protein